MDTSKTISISTDNLKLVDPNGIELGRLTGGRLLMRIISDGQESWLMIPPELAKWLALAVPEVMS